MLLSCLGVVPLMSIKTNPDHGNIHINLDRSFLNLHEHGGNASIYVAYPKMLVEPASKTNSSYFSCIENMLIMMESRMEDVTYIVLLDNEGTSHWRMVTIMHMHHHLTIIKMFRVQFSSLRTISFMAIFSTNTWLHLWKKICDLYQAIPNTQSKGQSNQ